MARRDVFVVGASAGGIGPLLQLVRGLPADLPASVLVAVHTSPEHPSVLPALLSARGKLPAEHAVGGEALEPGRIYVAPPDRHVLVRAGTIDVARGPRENGHRPAVDVLFRTASRACGPRVVAVVLSGHRDCGTAGAMSVRARGGLVLVQDPTTAEAPSMPRNVLERVGADHVAPPEGLAAILDRLARDGTPDGAGPQPAGLAALEGTEAGPRAEVVCPACHGPLSEAVVGRVTGFRCHAGHAFSLDALALEQAEEVERALWSAVRALEEGAALSRRIALAQNDPDVRRRLLEKHADQAGHAELIRHLLLYGKAPSR
jgi:two-component system chemotaxis response regulator CheB